MAWIELHQSVWSHRKTLLLADALEIDPIYAAAHMIHLWTWALDNAQDGDLSGLPPRVIAAGAGWPGDPERFVAAVVAAGFLDRDAESLVIHDWYDYAGRLIERREQHRERMRRARAKKATERAHHVLSTDGSRAQLPNHTKPNQEDTAAADNAPARATEPAAASPGEAQAREQTLELINRHFPKWTVSGRPYELLLSYADDLGWELILLAVQRTLGAGKTDIRYCMGILRRWDEAGIRTVEDMEVHEARVQAERQETSPQRRARSPTRQQPREIHPIDEFDWSGFDDDESG